MLPTIILLIGGVVLTAGDIMMKQWVATSSGYWYWIGLSVYIIGLNFLAQSFKYKDIATASVAFVLFNVISLSIVDRLFFNVKLTTLQLTGIIIGLIAIIVLELG